MGISAAGRPKMKLGFNWPWAFDAYGIWFGPHQSNPILGAEPHFGPQNGPETWTAAQINDPKWLVTGERDLAYLDGWVAPFAGHMRYLRNTLKMEVLRVFLLCNAQNFGLVGPSGKYRPPDYLHPRFRWHFKQILDAVRDAGMQLIPSLIDFGIADPDKPANQRWPILTDPNFFWMAFEPLLQISREYRPQIYAWEVMNEPSWINAHFFPREGRLKYVPQTRQVTSQQVSAFLKKGIAKIHEHGFESTVGHRYFSDMSKYPTGSIPQFHYYPDSFSPTNDDPNEIPDALAIGMNPPPIFGEIGTTDVHGGPWPELKGADAKNTPNRIFERLRLVRRKNYALAMLWPDKGYKDPKDITDRQVDAIKLSSDAELGVYQYLDYFNLR